MEKSIISQGVNNSPREWRKKKTETLCAWTSYFILFTKENLVFNPGTVFLSKDWLQNVRDRTITSFSLKYAARSCTWSTSFAWLTVCWLAGFPSQPPPLPFLNEKWLKGVVDFISNAQQHFYSFPRLKLIKVGTFPWKYTFQKNMGILNKLKTKQVL